MELDHPSELLLSILAKEHEREAFVFIETAHLWNPYFLTAFKTLISEGFIEEEKSHEIANFRVAEKGHQKVAELDEALWAECLPLFEESFRKYNQ